MTISPAALQGGLTLTTTPAALAVMAASTTGVIKKASFCNTSGSVVTVTVSITRSGGSALVISSAQSVAPGVTLSPPELINLVLKTGDTLSASASAGSSINAFVSGYTVI